MKVDQSRATSQMSQLGRRRLPATHDWVRLGIGRLAVGLRAGAAGGSEEVEPANGEDRTERSLLPEVDFFGGMLRRSTEGYSVPETQWPLSQEPQRLLVASPAWSLAVCLMICQS